MLNYFLRVLEYPISGLTLFIYDLLYILLLWAWREIKTVLLVLVLGLWLYLYITIHHTYASAHLGCKQTDYDGMCGRSLLPTHHHVFINCNAPQSNKLLCGITILFGYFG